MNFTNFPFETQVCKCRARSYHPDSVIEIKPMTTKSHAINQFLQDFSIKNQMYFHKISWGLHANGRDAQNYTEFEFEITLTRAKQPYLRAYFYPALALTVMAGLSFLIPATAIPARVAYLVTLLLTLQSVTNSVNVSHLWG